MTRPQLTGRTHELKTWPEPFTAIARGEKSWEFREDDRGYAVGDTLVLREWVPHQKAYTGRALEAVVTYILHSGFGLPIGHVIMSLVPAAPERVPVLPAAWSRLMIVLALLACAFAWWLR